MVIAGVNIYWQPIIIGVILIGAVVLDIVVQRRYQAGANLRKLETVQRRALSHQQPS
jgi:ribose/xylose/arabinose/galactoside ABC-type transport system permease subunit